MSSVNHRIPLLTARALALSGALAAAPAWAQCDEPGWLPADRPTGALVNGESILTSVEWDPDGDGPLPSRLVIAGGFYSAGGRLANSIASWDGANWMPMGDGLRDFNLPSVAVLHVHNGELYAGGRFLFSDQTFLYNIARWDGAAWQPLGDGTDGSVEAMTSFNGDLIVGGYFENAGNAPAPRIARWDGKQWHPMGNGFDGGVHAAEVFNGALYVGGGMEHSGSVTIDAMARWNGSGWVNVGGGLHSGHGAAGVSTLAIYNNKLVATGFFDHAGLAAAENVAQWTGSAWQAMGDGVQFPLTSTAVIGSDLIAVTPYHRLLEDSSIDPNSVNVHRWNGAAWSAMPRVNGSPSTVVSFRNEMIVTGNVFADVDGDRAGGVLRYDGAQWQTIGEQGLAHRDVAAMGEYNGQVVMAIQEDCVPRGMMDFGLWMKVATWDNGAVTDVLGIFQTNIGGVPYITDFVQDGNDLYVSGRFDLINGESILNVAKWDGKSWSQVGPGVGPSGIQVQSIAMYNGDLIAAGAFLENEGSPGNSIARWDGTAWQRMGSGLEYITKEWSGAGSVIELLVHDGQLIAVGGFTHADGVNAANIAAWDGTMWRPFPVGVPEMITGAALYQGGIAVSGFFTEIDGVSMPGAAHWNGKSWNAMGSIGGHNGDRGYATKMAQHNNDLYITGYFLSANGAEANNIAKWDGESWSPLGAGLQRIIYENGPGAAGSAIHVHEGELLVGGVFNIAGGEGAVNFARYCLGDGPACIADFNGNDVVNSQDFFDFLAAFFDNDPRADVNADDAVNSQDFFDFLTVFFDGCQ